MNEAHIVIAILGTLFTVAVAVLGWAWWGGAFKANTEAKDAAAIDAIDELRHQIQQLSNSVNHLAIQGAQHGQDIRNLQELRREMIATLDKIFDSLSRGQRS